MNLHQTRGREADTTILPLGNSEYYGPEGEPSPSGPRLLYVVMTRAAAGRASSSRTTRILCGYPSSPPWISLPPFPPPHAPPPSFPSAPAGQLQQPGPAHMIDTMDDHPESIASLMRTRYRNRLPSSLDELTGPGHGTVELPLHVAWSGLRAFDLGPATPAPGSVQDRARRGHARRSVPLPQPGQPARTVAAAAQVHQQSHQRGVGRGVPRATAMIDFNRTCPRPSAGVSSVPPPPTRRAGHRNPSRFAARVSRSRT